MVAHPQNEAIGSLAVVRKPRTLMDKLQRTVKQGSDGDEEAIAALKLCPINQPHWTKIETLNQNIINSTYGAIAKARTAAMLLGRDLLIETCRYLMEILQFLAKSRFQSHIVCHVRQKGAARQTLVQVRELKQFCLQSGEKADSGLYIGNLEWYESKVRAAIGGDSESMDEIGLHDLPSLKIKNLKEMVPFSHLWASFQASAELACVGEYMKDTTLQTANRYIMSFMDAMKREYYPDDPELRSNTDGQDVCEGLLTEVQTLEAFVLRVNKKRLAQMADMGERADEFIEEEDDPTYHPNSDSDQEDSDHEDSDTMVPPSVEEEGKTKKRRKTVKSDNKAKNIRLDSDITITPSARQPSKKANPKASRSKDDKPKRSHHTKAQCPICHKLLFDLKRHLRQHARKGNISYDEVGKVHSVAMTGDKRRGPRRVSKEGPKPGLKNKWCPFEGCDVVTHHMRSHLMHYHRMKKGATLEAHLRVAREYKGKTEREGLQTLISVSSDEEDFPPLDIAISPAMQSTATSSTPRTSASRRSFTYISTSTSTSTSTAITPSPTAMTGPSSSTSTTSLLPPTTLDSTSTTDKPDDDVEYEPTMLQEEFFNCPNPKTDRHKWLVAFHNHLSLPDAGRKKDRNRLQHASHIRTILEDLEPNGTGIDILSRDEGYIVWTDWVDATLAIRKTGTINAYLGTYQKFLQFVVEERIRTTNLPDLDEDCKRIFRNTIPKLKGWRRTVDLEQRPQRTRRILDECDNRLTRQDVDTFLASPLVVHAKRLFEMANKGFPMTEREIGEARDYLLCLITLKTGTRPGALENASLADYKTMRQDPETGHHVILVTHHKRQVDGPAMLSLDNELKSLVDTYVMKMLPRYPEPRDENLFLQSNGKAFHHGTLGKRLPEFWLRSGIRTDLRITATNIRKFIVTVCHQKKSEGVSVSEDVLRRAMCHSDKVARSNYMREDLTKVAAAAMDIITTCTTDSNVQPTSPEETSDQMEAAVTTTPTSAEDVIPKKFHRSSRASSETNRKGSHSGDIPVQTSPIRPLSENEKSVVQEAFKQHITTNAKIVLEDVRKVIRDHPTLSALEPFDAMAKKVADNVRYLQLTEPRKDPKELPEEPAAARVYDWIDTESEGTSESMSRTQWSTADTAVIEKHFGHLPKCPKKTDLLREFALNADLNEIRSRKTFMQCQQKVKNLLKSKRHKNK